LSVAQQPAFRREAEPDRDDLTDKWLRHGVLPPPFRRRDDPSGTRRTASVPHLNRSWASLRDVPVRRCRTPSNTTISNAALLRV
jgi:hypothetical protein